VGTRQRSGAKNCPVCGADLQKFTIDGQTVDRCPECSGVYFGRGQLESIVRIVRLFRSVQLDEPDIDAVPEEERQRVMACPSDGGVMAKRQIAGLTVDVCDRCGGVWLDDGEITALKMAETHVRGNIQLYIRLGR
jgi:Zn-finger nucleic acid-binding protein